MYMKNVTMDDDSLTGSQGSYECHAFAVGDVVKRASHGFVVTVIPSTYPVCSSVRLGKLSLHTLWDARS